MHQFSADSFYPSPSVRRQIAAACIALACTAAVDQNSSHAGLHSPDTDALAVRKALEGIAGGRGDIERLTVTYDDLHGLHVGLRLTIHGNGRVEQKTERQKAGKPRNVARRELIKLARLLVKHAAWEQRVAERPPVRDESRASLAVTYGQNSVQIWEWYNDLDRNHRIGDIIDFMMSIAWTQPAAEPSKAGRTPPLIQNARRQEMSPGI